MWSFGLVHVLALIPTEPVLLFLCNCDDMWPCGLALHSNTVEAPLIFCFQIVSSGIVYHSVFFSKLIHFLSTGITWRQEDAGLPKISTGIQGERKAASSNSAKSGLTMEHVASPSAIYVFPYLVRIPAWSFLLIHFFMSLGVEYQLTKFGISCVQISVDYNLVSLL